MDNKKHHEKRRRLLEGSVFKSLVTISLPIILANLMQSLYQFIDTFWVGRMGAESVAAVFLSFPILFFLNSLAMGFTMAGSILVAQYNGKKDDENVSLTVGQTFSLVMVISVLIAWLGYIFSPWLIGKLTSDVSVYAQAVSYLRISFLAMPGSFLFIIFQSSLRGVGEVVFPVKVVLLTVIVDFLIDPLFMRGWGVIPAMGVTGVALATLVTEYMAGMVGIWILYKGTFHIRLRWNDFKFRFNWIKKIVKLGLPSSLEMSSRSVGMVLMTIIVSSLGTYVVAAYGIGIRILSFIIIPAIGLSISTSALVGNNLGARQFDRADKIVKTAIKLGWGSLTFAGILLFVFAKQSVLFFVPGDLELAASASLFLKSMSLTFGFIGVQMVIGGTLKAAGKTTVSMFLALVNTSVLLFLSLTLSKWMGWREFGIWIAYPAANVGSVLVAWFLYARSNWLNKRLV